LFKTKNSHLDSLKSQMGDSYYGISPLIATRPLSHNHLVLRKHNKRTEAMESVFIMHQIAGSPSWAKSSGHMFKSIVAHCRTAIAPSAIGNAMEAAPKHVDEMQSFLLAETWKYFICYLVSRGL
jgi:hypothetical protein